MPRIRRCNKTSFLSTACCILTLSILTFAADSGSIRGTVSDPLGAVVPSAKVELLQGDQIVATTVSNPSGQYVLRVTAAGRYHLRASAPSFHTLLAELPYVSNSRETVHDISLTVEALAQQITVTDKGTPTPLAQTGAAVTVLTSDSYQYTRDIEDPLRLVPGVQLTQAGQPGAAASLYIRGGNSNFNKVLVDGTPADDIGGLVNFANLASAGIEKIEVLRGPNSALYGSDALAGVVSLNTARGTTPLPEFSYRIDGGNFGTYHQEATLGGAYKQFDYFSDFSRFDTANSIPNSEFHNGTYAGNFGWAPVSNTSLRVTLRHVAIADGNANAIELYGIPDAAGQKEQDTYIGATFENQTTERWHNLVRYGALRLRGQFTDYAPTGIPYPDDIAPFEYLGAPVTLNGANGYTVSGQAAFQYAGTYPNQDLTSTDRDFVYAQSDYRFTPHLTGLVGFKYEDERGYTLPTGFPRDAVDWGNYSYTLQINGDFWNRLYYTIGSGIEDNALFGIATTPRASLAYYLFRPSASSWLDGTKLRFSFGKGIKEPSIFYQTNSLYQLLAGLPGGSQLISQYHVAPINAEWSRTYDGGVDQDFFGGRGRLGITYFHNQFTNGIEYVSQQALVDLGVPTAVAQATQFGAAVNSETYRAQGFETELEYQITKGLSARGGYTYLDAVVLRSFSSDALSPSFNPSFPTVPIGAFSPLVGARPFRRAPHSGYFGLDYSRSRWLVSLSGTLVGRRDDSDFLFDANGGTTMLLPNRNLDAGYQRIDLSGSYRVNRMLTLYSNLQNLLSQHYSEAFGYPALPFTIRAGIKITLGGDSWKLK